LTNVTVCDGAFVRRHPQASELCDWAGPVTPAVCFKCDSPVYYQTTSRQMNLLYLLTSCSFSYSINSSTII